MVGVLSGWRVVGTLSARESAEVWTLKPNVFLPHISITNARPEFIANRRPEMYSLHNGGARRGGWEPLGVVRTVKDDI